ncbi:MFS transporter, FHS family, glucose/mannose:H+ symporter [Paenibacillus sp. 1_12]|uniref:MFS transporter n=1 Tax=Paenibacillus sp. 1_12 TaxID=1566278 RepID=UPI0008EFEC26|nr:MFS transporter [Paenibacillus sp. 1_12]SFM20376.1 MFS transporter, FHS family, glucose/mannose:H+ symporter [Paenibacillus sp. 1_12]
MNRLIWVCCCFYLLIGITSVVIAALLPELLSHYGRNYADGGNLIFVQFCGFLLGVLTQPLWSRKFGRLRMLSFTLWFIFVGFMVIAILPPWTVVLCFIPMVGFGSGIIESTIGAMIIDSIKDRTAVAMSRLEVFYGVGALSMPILISILIASGYWKMSFYATCLFALLLAWAWSRFTSKHGHLLAHKKSAENRTVSIPDHRGFIPFAMVSTCILLFFVYVGLEMSLVNFLPSILLETMHIDAAFAALSVSFYWGAMIVGRLVCGLLAEKFGYTRYLLWSTIGTFIVLACFLFVKTAWAAFAIITLMGLLMSGLFAIALIFSNSLFPGRTEQTTSKLIAASGLGGACMSWLTGRFMEQTSIAFTLYFLVGLSALMVLLIVVMTRLKPIQATATPSTADNFR